MSQNLIEIACVARCRGSSAAISDPEMIFCSTAIDQTISPWLLYYAKWLDPWLMGDSYEKLSKTKPVVNLKELPNNIFRLVINDDSLKNIKNSLRCKHQFREQHWLAWHIVEAVATYSNVKLQRIIFIKRTILNVSSGDDEILRKIRDA